jgi:hypothetical protein
MGKAHQNQKKTAQPKSETNAVAARKDINTINGKQTPPQTHKDLWNSAIRDRLNFEHRILQCFQFKTLRSILNAPWCIHNHSINEDLQSNKQTNKQTNTVLSEIKKSGIQNT